MKKKVAVVVKNRKTGEVMPIGSVEDGGLLYHPANQPLDLSHEEKRRTTALMMAIQAHEQMIIKDADYYRAVKDDELRNQGPAIKPATFASIVEGADRFDLFISGQYQHKEPSPSSTDNVVTDVTVGPTNSDPNLK